MMTYDDLKRLSKSIDNSISFEDFEQAATVHNYNKDYVETIWRRWCNNPIYFMASHEMGETIFEMLSAKIQGEKQIN